MKSHNSRTVILRTSRLLMATALVLSPLILSAQSSSSRFGSSSSSSSSSSMNSGSNSGFGSSSNSSFGSSSNSGSSSSSSGSGSSRSLRDRDRNSDRDNNNNNDSERRSSRRKSRDKDDDSKKPTPAAEGVPARAAPQAASKRARGGAAGGGGGSTSMLPEDVSIPEFKISNLIQSDSLYFSPAEIQTPRGWRFSSPLHYYNAGGHAVDRLDLWIKYSPELLEPVTINVDGLRANGAINILNEVYREWGYVRIRATFDPVMTQLLLPVATINWRAIAGPATAFINVEAPPNESCGLFAGDGSAIYNPQILNKGLVSLRVRIGEDYSALEGDDPAFRFIGAGEDPMVPSSNELRPGVRLGLLPQTSHLEQGDLSTLDVVIINPALVAFDRLQFRLRYNPDDIEVLDADEDNYITRGVNIYDGGFHDAMPFDLHAANNVNADSGAIEYSVGNQNASYPYPTGTVARVAFRVKRASGAAFFWFEGSDPASGTRASDVLTRGRSVLGNPNETADKALHNVMLNIGRM